MVDIGQKFFDAKIECLKTDYSVFSVGKLYDLIYMLEDISNRNYDENYILAEIYNFLGNTESAINVISKNFINLDKNQTEKLKNLHNEIIERQNSYRIKLYRDLRDAIILKDPTKLKVGDFEILKSANNDYCYNFSKKIKNIVILNKSFPIDKGSFFFDFFIDSSNQPDDFLIKYIIEHIEWLGKIKDELLNFYNNNFFEEKLYSVGQSWFDNLEVIDFNFGIDKKNNIDTTIYLNDHIQYGYGFIIEIENRTIKKIEYNSDL